VRRQLATEGIVTVFNLLGPLLNPARPANQLVGIFRPELLRKYVEVLRLLGRTSAWAVNGTAENDCGMDEISILGPTRVARLRNELIDEFELEPAQFVSGPVSEGILTGGDANENAATTTGILNGEIRDARRDIVVANAAAAFVIADLAPDLETGIQRAREEIDSGRAAAVLKSLVDAA
jgi:anthranilate phosphoribosyltransferase